MRLKHLSAGLLAGLLTLPAGFAPAQDRPGPNVMAEAPAGQGAVADLALAQKLYDWGVENGSIHAVMAAVEMLSALDISDDPRQPVQAAIEGAAPPVEDGTDPTPPADLAIMLAMARQMAGDDPTLLGLIEDIEASGSRGRIGGASRSLSRLPAAHRDTFRVVFKGGELAELAIVGDGDADLDLLVTDETGNTICYDTSYSDQIYCSWTPARDGEFTITIKNMGKLRNSYYLLTN